MRAWYRDLGLILPASAEFPGRPDQDGAGLGVDEQLWDVVRGHPLRIIRRYLHHIGRRAFDRNLPRPGQGRPTVLRLQKRAAIFGHLGLGQFPQHRSRQHPLDEHVALEDHLFALVGAEALEDRHGLRAPVGPGSHRAHDRLHVGDAPDTVAVMIGPVEAECRAPVVHHEQDRLRWTDHGIDEGREIVAVGDEAIGVGTRIRQFAGIAHANQIRHDQPAASRKLGHNIAPKIG